MPGLVESVGARSMALCASGADWARHGAEHPLGPDFSGAQDLLPQVLDEETVLAYADRVPTSLIRESCLAGTPSEIVEQLAERHRHGLRYPVLCNVSVMCHRNLSRGLRTGMSFLRVLRGAKRL